MSKNLKNLKQALEIATVQRENHAHQVSGCWSISGKEFCEEYDLDYDQATEAQDEDNRDNLYDLVYDRKRQYADITGTIDMPEEVEDKIWQKAEDDFYFEVEAYGFWNDIVEQIENSLKGEN